MACNGAEAEGAGRWRMVQHSRSRGGVGVGRDLTWGTSTRVAGWGCVVRTEGARVYWFGVESGLDGLNELY